MRMSYGPVLQVSVQFSSVQSCPTLCDPMNCSTPGLPVHHQLLKFTQAHVHRVGNAIQPFHPLSSPLLLPAIPPSIRVFSSESTLHVRWPKYWSFSFSVSPCSPRNSQESSPTPQFKSINFSALSFLSLFMVQLSHPYMTIGKTIVLTRWTFVGKVLSLLFNMLSR